MMKKYCLDLTVKSIEHINEKYVLIKLTDDKPLPKMLPGQFVEVKVDNSPNTMLRRPISINNVDYNLNELHLLVACIGEGTRHLGMLVTGDKLNVVLPLGHGFTLPDEIKHVAHQNANMHTGNTNKAAKLLLVGGGVGVAPLLYFGRKIREMGCEPTFLLGARRANDLLMLSSFESIGRVFVTTEDGSQGQKGFVTNHSIWQEEQFDLISTCGPKPMMMAVARLANKMNTPCEVSLENKMACGLGACLCCVEHTNDNGNICVCTEGPVINANRLDW